MKPVNFAFLGAGEISEKMATTITQIDSVTPYAVAARDEVRAKEFAARYAIPCAYGSYDEMLADPQVELVYIATPHSHHHAHAMAAIAQGKHVLCEKAFTSDAQQAREVLEAGAQKGVLVAEAIWTRYMPLYQTMTQILQEGAIGTVYSLTANLGYNVKHKNRLTDPALAGGALLDIGVYPINFASAVFGGNVTRMQSCAVIGDTGVDLQSNITLCYEDRLASLYSSMLSVTDRRGVVYGETGYLVMDNINCPKKISIYSPKWELQETIHKPSNQISGYEYEVAAAVKAIRSGMTQCPQMPHAEIIRIMELLDDLRKGWGVQYPWEE